MKFKLIKLWKEDISKKSVLVFELKDGAGNKRTIRSATLQPRFYIPQRQMLYDDDRIVGTEPVIQKHILTGENMVRVYTDVTGSVGSLRKSTYRVEGEPSIASQADILFPELAMIESDLYAGIEISDNLLNMDSLPFEEFKTCEAPHVSYVTNYLDIECQHSPNVLPDIKKEKDVIYQIGTFQESVLKYFWLDNGFPIPTFEQIKEFCIKNEIPVLEQYDPNNVMVFKTEQELLSAFLDYFETLDPDVLTGWNIAFDVDYITGRCKRYRLGTRWWNLIRKLNIHDSMEAYKRLYRAPSGRFKDVVIHEEITDNVVEDEHDVRWWRDGMNSLCFTYNGYDVVWLEALDIKKSIIEHDWGVKEMAGFPDINPTNWRMPIVDILALREARDDFILPSKMEWDDIREKGDKKKGAIVFDPKNGASFNVAVLDFSMYYPYIIIAHNLSKEIPAGQLTPKGIIPKVCERLIKHRLSAKAAEKAALKQFGPESVEKKKAKRLNDVSKFMLNSVFGVTGNPSFRLYEKRVFESITGYGREGLIDIKKMAEDRGYEVIYGDTDSLFIKFDNYQQAEEFAEEINIMLNKMYKEKYGLTVSFDIKVEKWLSPVVFSKKRDKSDEAGKKRYFYRVVIEDGINLEELGQDYVVIMGHDGIKRSASPLCKFVQKKVFEDIAFGRIDQIEPFLKECWEKYTAGEFELDSVAARMTINKDFDDYKQKTVAVRGAEFLNAHMNPSVPVTVGDTVRYVYVKSVDGKRTTDVISYCVEKDVEGRIEVDWETMFEKQIIAKTEDVLADVDIYWEQIMGQTDLLSLF